MNTTPRFVRPLLWLAASSLAVASVSAAPKKPRANDYPTVERVLYVEGCLEEHPGPRFEMRSKCACTIDKIASKVAYNDFETMNTASKAFSIGGERGGYIRDNKGLTDQIKQFRDLQAEAKKSCFINIPQR